MGDAALLGWGMMIGSGITAHCRAVKLNGGAFVPVIWKCWWQYTSGGVGGCNHRNPCSC